jgi:preprotein translocase subunit SecF
MLLGLASIFLKGGLQYDIDFTGGALVELRLATATPIGVIRSRLAAAGLGDSVIQIFDNPRDVLIRTHLSKTSATELSRRIAEALDPDRTGGPEVRRVDVVGAQIGSELRTQALYAVLAALGGILLYIWMRFDFRGGVVTIISLGHDVLICLGALSLTNREFSLPVLAALLTVIGFSVNDRIVMYDRLREIQARATAKTLTFYQQVNLAVNQTLSRTVLTVATVAMSGAMLFLFGGESLHNFGFVILVGALTGTTSTVYVAAALDVDWVAWADRRRASRPGAGGRGRTGRGTNAPPSGGPVVSSGPEDGGLSPTAHHLARDEGGEQAPTHLGAPHQLGRARLADVEHGRQRAFLHRLLDLRDAVHARHDVPDSLRAFPRRLDPALLLTPRRQLARDEAETAHDRGEGIVDLVRSGARQQRHRSELNGVAARCLDRMAGHDVGEESGPAADTHQADQQEGQPQRREEHGATLAER